MSPVRAPRTAAERELPTDVFEGFLREAADEGIDIVDQRDESSLPYPRVLAVRYRAGDACSIILLSSPRLEHHPPGFARYVARQLRRNVADILLARR